MRSVDADELKKYKFTTQIANGVEIEDIEVVPVAAIDNAQTIEEKSYAMGFQDGVEDGLQGLRPEGEWVYGEDECGQDGWFCSECGFFVPWYYEYYEKDIDFIREYKACPHCLAEMVTYTGKDRDTKGGTK